MICGSGGSKSRLAKAAGAEPSGQMRDEKLHAVVARSTFPSQNVQSTPLSDHFWKLRCRTSARRCGAKMREAYFQVEKGHAVVARSTFLSQNVQSTPCSDHFWKLRQSESKDMLSLHSEKKITQRRFSTQKPLHREGFTQSSFYTDAFAHRCFYIQKLLHRKAFSKRSLSTWSLCAEQLYTQTLFHKEVFTHRNFKAQMPKLLHTGPFAHTHTLQKKLLDTETFTAFSQESFYTEAFAQRCLYKQKLLHTVAFTQRSL